MKKDPSRVMRDQLLELLRGGGAHLTFDDAVADLPASLRGAKPAGQPHTPWRLIEHIRIAQHDILEFSRNPKYEALSWPADYWPAGDAPPTAKTWTDSLRQYRADNQSMQDLVADAGTDLLAPIPHGKGQTIFREAMLVADHTAYHLGQLVILRRMLGAWSD